MVVSVGPRVLRPRPARNCGPGYVCLLVLAGILGVSGLQAEQKLRINAGWWGGPLRSELENRFWLDDIVEGDQVDRVNLPWIGRETSTIYPLGLEYLARVGPGKLIIGGNYVENSPDYKYAGLTNDPTLSLVRLYNYETVDYEGGLGYELEITPRLLHITPRVGFRQHFQEFSYTELTVGGDDFLVSLDSPFYSSARSAYGGLGIQYFLSERTSILLEGLYSPPIFAAWGGNMTHERIRVGRLDDETHITYDRAESAYEIVINRGSIGMQYDLSDEIHFRAGYREEVQFARYPGYYNLPLIVRDNTIDFDGVVKEFITDYIVFDSVQSTRKGFAFFEISLDVNIVPPADRGYPGGPPRGGGSDEFNRDFGGGGGGGGAPGRGYRPY